MFFRIKVCVFDFGYELILLSSSFESVPLETGAKKWTRMLSSIVALVLVNH